MNHVVQLNNVSLTYENKQVLKDVNFKLNNGEFVYLIGSTGAGKSSFLKLIYRDITPDAGEIFVNDFEVHKLPERKVPFLRRSIGIVFQDFQLLPDRNVYDNIAFALQVTNQPKKVIKQRSLEVLSLVGLNHKRNQMPGDLSGGEQQRVVIARSLVNEPKIMLADEPTGNLDPEATRQIMELLMTINNRGMAVLMITHNYDIVKKYPCRTLRIHEGSLQQVRVPKNA